MAEPLDELLKLLQDETAVYRHLLKIMERERMALLHSCRTEIEACTAGRSYLIGQLQVLERQRSEVVQRLATLFGCPVADVTVSRLTRMPQAPHRAALRKVRGELWGLMAQVKEENRRSEALWRHIGELLRAAYGTLRGLTGQGFVYHRGGRLEPFRLNGKLVCDEI